MPGKQEILDLMNRSEAVYLATQDGRVPRLRALVNLRRSDLFPGAAEFCRKEGFTCYCSTSAASSKVAELFAHPEASLYYCDPRNGHGVTLSGRVEILADQALKTTLWDDSWRIYWPGPEDPDYVILRMTPVEAFGWWGTKPFRLSMGSL